MSLTDSADILLRVAYHEAGHIVAAHVLGEPVGTAAVGLSETGEPYGFTRWRRFDALGFTRLRRATAERLLDVYAAGTAAEMILLQRPLSRPLPLTGRWDGDLWGITEALRAAPQIAKARPAKAIRTRAPALRALLETHWSAVEAIAHELRRTGRMRPSRARTLISLAGDNSSTPGGSGPPPTSSPESTG